MTPGERRLVAKFIREAFAIRYGKAYPSQLMFGVTPSSALQSWAKHHNKSPKRAVEIHDKIRDLAAEIITFLSIME